MHAAPYGGGHAAYGHPVAGMLPVSDAGMLSYAPAPASYSSQGMPAYSMGQVMPVQRMQGADGTDAAMAAFGRMSLNGSVTASGMLPVLSSGTGQGYGGQGSGQAGGAGEGSNGYSIVGMAPYQTMNLSGQQQHQQ